MSKWISAPLLIVLVNVCWLIGGQGMLAVRRFLIAPLMASYAYFYSKKRRFAWIFFIFWFLLTIGYGENSVLMRLCRGSETAVRAVMAVLISVVFVAYILACHLNLLLIPAILWLNVIAWQVRAGSLGKVLGKDVLIPDILRATAFSLSLIILLR